MMPHFESVSVLAEPLRIAFLGPLASFSHQVSNLSLPAGLIYFNSCILTIEVTL
jgi:hypothetical protein